MPAHTTPVDPHEFGLVKAAHGVGEVLEQLSIGRTSLYPAAKRRELTPVSLAPDVAAFLTRYARWGRIIREKGIRSE